MEMDIVCHHYDQEELKMKGLKIVKWENGNPWPEVIELKDRGEFSSKKHFDLYGWCWRNYRNEMTIFFANDKGERIGFALYQLARPWNN